MLLNTRHFGEIKVDEENIVSFAEGLPGFEQLHRYIVIDNSDEESPFGWLQCIDEPELAFAVVNPFAIMKDYDIQLPDYVAESLGIEKPEDVAVYSIVVVPDDISKTSMNLKAPVVVNNLNKKGVQIVLDTDKYSVRHYIVEELRRQEVGSHVGSGKEAGSVDSDK